MNMFIEWEGGVPEPLASIYRAMSGDSDALVHAARQLWGNKLVNGINTDAGRKAQRVEDMLDGKDPIERIEDLLEAGRSRPSKPTPATVEPDEVSTREACLRLSISAKTLRKLVRAGRLARRNASPPGSGKPNYRYRIVEIDRLKSQGYYKVAQPQESTSSRPKVRRRKLEPQTYEHLDL
ncbi:MAG TPA: helix-turn-helix domain-containing protein [Gemmataceae bacterium]|nr:helix-turn-helix domain-containing protein [Gemmataceae bacterium]